MHRVEQRALRRHDPVPAVADVATRTRPSTSAAVPLVQAVGALAKRLEERFGVDQVVGLGFQAQVLAGQAQPRVARQAARAVAATAGIDGLAFVARRVEDRAR